MCVFFFSFADIMTATQPHQLNGAINGIAKSEKVNNHWRFNVQTHLNYTNDTTETPIVRFGFRTRP